MGSRSTFGEMAGRERKLRDAPFIIVQRHVGVAKPAAFHRDLHIIGRQRAGIVFGELELRAGALACQALIMAISCLASARETRARG